jgi:3-methyladenine DNA glycosylase AlkD
MQKKSNLLNDFRQNLRKLGNLEKKAILQRFFKTGKGQYGEGDIFLGITVPQQRQLIKSYFDLSFTDLENLLNSKVHEERLSALLLLVEQYKKAVKQKLLPKQKLIYEFYLANAKKNNINNWDLVDLSAPQIVGHFLYSMNRRGATCCAQNLDKNILHKLVCDKNLWQRRIAMLATFYFIKQNEFNETLALAKKLLTDKEDLMHKATGWMLREISKRDFTTIEKFLLQHYQKMPRTMLRYAIEKFPEKRRLEFLHGKI